MRPVEDSRGPDVDRAPVGSSVRSLLTVPVVIAALMTLVLSALGAARDDGKPASGVMRDALLRRAWTTSDGLGPLANAQSCAACHRTAPEERVPLDGQALVLVSPSERDPTGGMLFRRFLFRPGRAVVRNALPSQVAGRRPPSLFGLALPEAVPDAALRAFADPEDANHDGISGRIRTVNGRVARFGWKDRFARLEDSVAAALAGEMGLTTPRFPLAAFGQPPPRAPEVDGNTLAQLADEVRKLPASATTATREDNGAAVVFEKIGCAACHRPQLPIVNANDARPAGVAHAYTDLLLHDMGPALSDGFSDREVSGSEFRTAPLWGVGNTGPFLHDGRAKTLDEAIRMHGGEAGESAKRYADLTVAARERLLAFVERR